MATAAGISPSNEKAYYMRVQALLVDGVALVLRNLIEAKYPGPQWIKHLNQQRIRAQLTNLRNKKAINNDQFDILYPASGSTDLTKYDVSLLVCLLRNICGLNTQSVVWNGVPASRDHSEEADIRRLNIERNKMAHSTRAVLSEQEFENHWTYITEALCRLGSNIPDLQENLDNLKQKTIDPIYEREMQTAIETWEKLDKTLQEDLEQIKSTVSEHEREVGSLKSKTDSLVTVTGQIQTSIKETENKIESVTIYSRKIQTQTNTIEQNILCVDKKQSDSNKRQDELEHKMRKSDAEVRKQVQDTDKRVDEIEVAVSKTSNEVEHLRKEQKKNMSTELKNISDITKMYLEDSLSDDVYVETSVHREAKEKLTKNYVVVLSGHPGEGKTTMATKLMTEVSETDKCLQLSQPSDWRHVVFEQFDTIFIDDIFGPGVLDEKLVKDWDRFLPEIWRCVQKKKIKLIIATRHYILKEARQIFNRSSVFKDEHVQFLSSEKLSVGERTEILTSHFRSCKIEDENMDLLIAECVALSTSFLETFIFKKSDFLFGFPECANMFVRNAELYERGADFFMRPNEFFRKCVEDLRNDEEKFLALLVIWSRQEKVILQKELDISCISNEISHIVEHFGFKLEGKLMKILRKSLQYHQNGFLQFSSTSGAYRFSHNVINDMVGLVISEDFPEACLDFTDKHFFQEFISINSDQQEQYTFFVDEYLHERLMATCLRLSSNPSHFLTLVDRLSLKRGGWRPNQINSTNEIDASIFLHEIFSDRVFSSKFVRYLVKEGLLEKMLSHPVMEMSGFFLSYGFRLDTDKIFLPTYLLFHTDGILFMEFLQHKRMSCVPGRDINDDMYLALLIAVHRNQVDIVTTLIKQGAEVSEESIYVAAIRNHIEILRLLVNAVSEKVVSKGEYENGNNSLIVASKKGLTESVRILVKHSNLSFRNNSNVSALEKAVIYQKLNVARILVENGAPLNEKSSKFKRTPLHMACDIGQVEMVDVLLKAGARLDIKDKRGHYAIHCAAIKGHIEVVEILAARDARQVSWRIASYGKKSFICGMTVFHVAVWKNNVDLTKILLEISHECNVRDWYGRTPLYCATYEGKLDIFKLLLPYGDVRQPDKHGYTPLHAAIHKRRDAIVEILLPMSDVNAQDKFGKTPLHTACKHGFCEIVSNLLEHGADPYMITNDGDNARLILMDNRSAPFSLGSLIEQLDNLANELEEHLRQPKVNFSKCYEIIPMHTI